MIWLALLLLAVACTDLVPDRPRWVGPLVGTAVVVAVAALSGFATPADWIAVVLAAATSLAWSWARERGERSAPHATATLAMLAGPALALVAFSGFASPVAGPLADWLGWIDVPALATFEPQRVLMLVALGVANTATGNRIVRLALVSVHAQPPRLQPPPDPHLLPSETLRGGRLLGPMERLLILGFGVGGFVEAAGLVVAAKGLLRFPQLQAAARQGSQVDAVTEYFLIGTFTSILVALGSVVLSA